jgi:radial spoke head protein 9
VNDYYVAVGLKYTGIEDFPQKRFFWSSSSTNWAFAELPKPLVHLGKGLFERIQAFYTGEFDRILIDREGKLGSQDYQLGDDLIIEPSNFELPAGKKGITELDRLSYLVYIIEKECQTVPIGALKMTPIHEVRRNEGFRGLRGQAAFALENYVHFRAVLSKEKRDLIDRDDGIFNNQFLDTLAQDPLKGAWTIQKDTTESVAIIRNKLWPGYYAYHKTNSAINGSLYIGNGLRNNDLPFML